MANTFRRQPTNWIEEGVRLMGGPTKTANFLEISGTHVYRMMKEGRMPSDTEEARERVSKFARRTGIELLNLLGFGQPFVGDGTELDATGTLERRPVSPRTCHGSPESAPLGAIAQTRTILTGSTAVGWA